MLMVMLLSIIAGASIVAARNINSMLAEKIGLIEGTFFNYITGFTVSLVFLAISRETIKLSYSAYAEVPFWAYMGGLLGVVVVAASNMVTLKISAFYMTLIIFVGQLFTGISIDYIALNLFSWGKFVGGLLVIAGLGYNLRIDTKAAQEKTCS